MILLNIFESEDSYEDVRPLSQKSENTLSSSPISLVSPILFILPYLSTSHNILRCQP